MENRSSKLNFEEKQTLALSRFMAGAIAMAGKFSTDPGLKCRTSRQDFDICGVLCYNVHGGSHARGG